MMPFATRIRRADCKEYMMEGAENMPLRHHMRVLSGRETACKRIFVSHRKSDEVVGYKLYCRPSLLARRVIFGAACCFPRKVRRETPTTLIHNTNTLQCIVLARVQQGCCRVATTMPISAHQLYGAARYGTTRHRIWSWELRLLSLQESCRHRKTKI